MFLVTFARLSSTFVLFYKTMPNDPSPHAMTLDTLPICPVQCTSHTHSHTHTHIPPYIHPPSTRRQTLLQDLADTHIQRSCPVPSTRDPRVNRPTLIIPHRTFQGCASARENDEAAASVGEPETLAFRAAQHAWEQCCNAKH